MQHLVKQNGLDWEVDSAGTGDWHVGEGPDRRSVRTAREQGIDISGQVCRLFRISDFDIFDHILVMDKSNYRNILATARNDGDKRKVSLLLEDKEVPDPYYDESQFLPVFKMIEQGCKDFIKKYNK
jgi:protein-tyrosine phosphatase